MTDPFGPVPRPKSKGRSYTTMAVTFGVISILGGLFATAIGAAAPGVSITGNLVITAIAAVGSLVFAFVSLSRREPRSTMALVVAGIAVLVTFVALVV